MRCIGRNEPDLGDRGATAAPGSRLRHRPQGQTPRHGAGSRGRAQHFVRHIVPSTTLSPSKATQESSLASGPRSAFSVSSSTSASHGPADVGGGSKAAQSASAAPKSAASGPAGSVLSVPLVFPPGPQPGPSGRLHAHAAPLSQASWGAFLRLRNGSDRRPMVVSPSHAGRPHRLVAEHQRCGDLDGGRAQLSSQLARLPQHRREAHRSL